MSFNKKFFATGGIVAASGVCNTDTADIFGDGNGKALYTFDYDGSDESANGYHLTPTGVTFGTGGNINYGLRGGESNSMMANTSIGYNYSDITVSWWVKLEGTGSTRLTFSNGGSLRFAFMRIHYNTTASQYRADLFTRTGTTSGTNSLVGYALIDTSLNGSWVHLAMRMGNTLEDSIRNGIYINGTKATMSYSVGSATSTAGVDDASPNRFYVGYYYSNALQEAFSIDIDHLRIFDRALTASEIGQLAGETACVHTATTTENDYQGTTAAYYKLDNSAEDEKGSYDGTETDIEYRFGRYGQAAVFNGSSSQITTGYTTNDSAFTISGWIKHTSTTFTSKYHYLAAKGYYSSASNTKYWYLANYSNANPEFRVRLNSSDVTATSSVAMNLNQWHHLAATVDSSGNMKIYLDGILTGSATGAPSRNMSQGINFGTFSGVYHHEGQMDQIRYYPSVLDADAIQNLYNEKPETDTSNFKTVLYEGTGATQYISNVGIDLETNGGLVWIKNRDSAYNHYLYDSIRGAKNILASDSNIANTPQSNGLSSFEANGFFLEGNRLNVNENNSKIVGWVFKGGGDAVTDSTTGDLTADISANTQAGFSIVNFTGVTATPDGVTVPHGLNSAPELVILKPISVSGDWQVYAYPVGNNKRLKLNDDVDATTTTGWDNTHPNSNNVTMEWSGTSKEYIMYCWHSVSGYSKIGTYTGNSSSTVSVTTNFRPSIVIIKNTDTASTRWVIYYRTGDTDSYYNYLFAEDSLAEQGSTSSTIKLAISDTGFTVPAVSSTWINNTGDKHLYMAFK